MPLDTLQKVLGHKSIISTQVYAELVNPKIKEDTDKICGRIGNTFRLAN
jgi:site-specific recombinase XerD